MTKQVIQLIALLEQEVEALESCLKQTQQQLQESEERFRNLVDMSSGWGRIINISSVNG